MEFVDEKKHATKLMLTACVMRPIRNANGTFKQSREGVHAFCRLVVAALRNLFFFVSYFLAPNVGKKVPISVGISKLSLCFMP